jgi:hypothetical protein
MRVLTNLLCKVTLFLMILTAPAMITGNMKDAGLNALSGRKSLPPYYSSTVIKRFLNFSGLRPSPIFKVAAAPETVTTGILSPVKPEPTVTETGSSKDAKEGAFKAKAVSGKALKASAARAGGASVTANASGAPDASVGVARVPGTAVGVVGAPAAAVGVARALGAATVSAEAKSREVKMVISEAVILYDNMSLEKAGLDEKAFEYAWRGYHNLLKKGLIRKRNVLSICDFSQSSHNKRMYVIDVRHKRLLYRTYVSHGQNSGAEYASSFSNEPDSYKSSLGFYITKRTYFGRNGLSLKIDGVDSGYNDQAGRRNIVLHGCSYASFKYLQRFGTLGTSLGCPAIPSSMSPKIIRIVKNGSCIFIYHPTKQYLEASSVING